MADINFWAVLVAGVAAFFAVFGYYAVLGDVLTRLASAPGSVLGEHGLLVVQVPYTDRENRTRWRLHLAEPAKVGLAVRPLPREALAAHRPDAAAGVVALHNARQRGSEPRHVVERGHAGQAAVMSVCPKSSPLKSKGSRASVASAYAKQSPKFNWAGLPLPRPKSR